MRLALLDPERWLTPHLAAHLEGLLRALQFRAFGGPEVLEWADAPAPHAGPGQIRIAVRAASVNPIDWKTFAGALSGDRSMVGTG